MNKNFRRLLSNRIYNDFLLNILASIIYTASTQFIAYPFLSRIVTTSEYGLILTLIGVANAIGVSIGNPLNNTKIILQDEYKNVENKGDFNTILLSGWTLNLILVSIISIIIVGKFSFLNIGLIIISSLVLFRSYFSVAFRLVINYKKNLLSSICAFFGYVFGSLITYLTGVWVFTFIFGELFSCIYIYINSQELIKEKFSISPVFKSTLKKYVFIMLAAVLSTTMMYMDRFFIFPFLGADQVSIYNVSSFLGKTAGIVMSPISGVLLTYYAKESHLTLKQFYSRMGVFILFSVLFYIGILVFGVKITGLLYPTIVEKTIPYINIANLATTIFILGNTIQPTLIRFCNVKWQPIIQVVYLILYLSLGIYGMKYYGLTGFCFAVMISNVIKVIMMILITTFTLKEKKKIER